MTTMSALSHYGEQADSDVADDADAFDYLTDVVIPARNESLETLLPTLRAFRGALGTGKIILVNDYTDTERATEVIRGVGDLADVIVPGPRLGKGQAVTAGLRYVGTEDVALCDGDLHGFSSLHADQLLNTLFTGMTLGILDYQEGHAPWHVPPDAWALMTGQRCVPTDLIRDLPLHGYAMQVQINQAIIGAELPIFPVRLHGCTGTRRWSDTRHSEMVRDGIWLANQAKLDREKDA